MSMCGCVARVRNDDPHVGAAHEAEEQDPLGGEAGGGHSGASGDTEALEPHDDAEHEEACDRETLDGEGQEDTPRGQ